MITEHALLVLLALTQNPSHGHVATRDTLQGVEVVTVRAGEGCLKTFGRTSHPLTLKGCRQFFRSLGRESFVDERVPMMPNIVEPVLRPGEQFSYNPTLRRWVPVSTNLR